MMPLPGWPAVAPNAYDNNNIIGIIMYIVVHKVIKVRENLNFGCDP